MSATKRAFTGGLLIFSILVLILEGGGPGFGMMQPFEYVTTTTATSLAPSSILTSKVTTRYTSTSILPGTGVSSASTTASSTSQSTYQTSTSVSYSTSLSTFMVWTIDYVVEIDTPIVFLMQLIYEWILLFIHEPGPVGGYIEPADRMAILGPYVWLLGIILAAGVAVAIVAVKPWKKREN